MGQVNIAISQMDSVTQQNAALSEEAGAAGQAIVQQVQQLSELIARYRLAEGGMVLRHAKAA